MSGTTENTVELAAIAAAQDAVIAAQAKRFAALSAELEHYKRLAAALTERVRRESAGAHPPTLHAKLSEP